MTAALAAAAAGEESGCAMAGQGIVRPFKAIQFNQEKIVFAIAVVMFAIFAVTLNGFLDLGNILSLIQNVSILGILGIGMAQAIIGRGIDLSMVANMAMSVAWVLNMVNGGTPLATALALGLGLTLVVGVINGILIAYVEIPAIFTTLAMGTSVYGLGHSVLVDNDVVYLPKNIGWLKEIGGGSLLGVPTPVISLAIFGTLAFLFLRYTKPGRFIFAMGDNPPAARIVGIPARPMMVLQYVLSAAVAFVAGMITATAVDSMNTRVATSTLVYDVILVVVIGGVGLSGGKGSVRNVVVGTLLIGTLLNGMTILDVPYTLQNIIKSVILLIAIVVDSIVNPRDEQTSQQGDI
jgi:ribose transport system permease protein